MGWAEDEDDPDDEIRQSQRVVSFTETPLEHIYSHVVDIAHRSGHPLDENLRGKVHDAINDAFARYRVVAAALSAPDWKQTGPQRVVSGVH